LYDPKKLATFDPVLTGFALGYQNQTLIGERLFPVVDVSTQSGSYFIFDRSNWLIYPDRREPGTEPNMIGGRKWSSDVFNVKEHALEAEVLDEEREEIGSSSAALTPAAINPEADAVEDVTNALVLRHEKKVADTVRNTANYAAGHTVTLAGPTQWSDYGMTSGSYNSNPFQNFRDAMTAIYRDTGRQPNLAWFSWDAWQAILYHPLAVARFQYVAGVPPTDAFAQLTGFNGEILIGESVYNSADNVDATENIVTLWGKDAGLAIVEGMAGFVTKTWGKTFVRPYGGERRPVFRWRVDSHFKDMFAVKYRYDTKIVSNVAGYLFKNAVA
jgi:hypothetical protein